MKMAPCRLYTSTARSPRVKPTIHAPLQMQDDIYTSKEPFRASLITLTFNFISFAKYILVVPCIQLCWKRAKIWRIWLHVHLKKILAQVAARGRHNSRVNSFS